MPQERLPKQALLAKVKGKGQWDDQKHAGQTTLRIYLGRNRLGLQPSEMLEVVADRDMWQLNLELLPSQPSQI